MFIVNECTFTGYNLIYLDLDYLIAIWFEENLCLSTNMGIDNKPIQIYIPLPGIEFFLALGIGMAGYFMCKMLPREERTIWKNQIEARYFIIYDSNGEELRIFAHIDPNDPYGSSLRLLHMYNSNVRFILVIMYNRRWLAVCGRDDWSALAIDDGNWNNLQSMVHSTTDVFQPSDTVICLYAPDINHKNMLETAFNIEYVTGFDPYQIPIIISKNHQSIPLIGVRICPWSVLQPVVLCPEFR